MGRVVRASRSRGKVFQTELLWTGIYQRAALETQVEGRLGVMLSVPLKGPLLVRVEHAGGRTANGGSLFRADAWVGGVRTGIGAETPLGPLRLEYGRHW